VTEQEKALLQLPAKPVSVILEELHAIRQRAAAGEDVIVPLVTLHLHGGRDLPGWIIDLAEDRRGKAVLFHSPGPDIRRPDPDALYLDPGHIQAITVHNAGQVAHLLSFGKIKAPPGVPPPTKLELRRKLEALGTAVAEATGAALAFEASLEGVADGEPMRALLGLAVDASEALKEVARDDLGREGLAKLKRVLVSAAAEPSVTQSGGVLAVRGPVDGKAGLSRSDLRKGIEALL
jgi:hypothetical protein